MSRVLADCPAVIFIAYTIPMDAEERGYSDWLVQVDNPFFNAVPGVHHYANWRVRDILQGATPVWDYFDFQGIVAEEDLKHVWFSPDLDAFRSEWLRLWGYGGGQAPPVLRHAYVMRPIARRAGFVPGPTLTLRGGVGPLPVGLGADLAFSVDGVLKKHFGNRGLRESDWLTHTEKGNPLQLDWLAINYGPVTDEAVATLALRASLISEPADDRASQAQDRDP